MLDKYSRSNIVYSFSRSYTEKSLKVKCWTDFQGQILDRFIFQVQMLDKLFRSNDGQISRSNAGDTFKFKWQERFSRSNAGQIFKVKCWTDFQGQMLVNFFQGQMLDKFSRSNASQFFFSNLNTMQILRSSSTSLSQGQGLHLMSRSRAESPKSLSNIWEQNI